MRNRRWSNCESGISSPDASCRSRSGSQPSRRYLHKRHTEGKRHHENRYDERRNTKRRSDSHESDWRVDRPAKYLPLGPQHPKTEWLRFEGWLEKRRLMRINMPFNFYSLWRRSESPDVERGGKEKINTSRSSTSSSRTVSNSPERKLKSPTSSSSSSSDPPSGYSRRRDKRRNRRHSLSSSIESSSISESNDYKESERSETRDNVIISPQLSAQVGLATEETVAISCKPNNNEEFNEDDEDDEDFGPQPLEAHQKIASQSVK